MLTKLAEALDRLFHIDDDDEPLVCSARSFTLSVRCATCGEVIRVRVDRDHELQAVYAEDANEGDRPLEYELCKELVGERCQNLIRFTIKFNCDHGLIDSQISGGEFVEQRDGRSRAALEESAELST